MLLSFIQSIKLIYCLYNPKAEAFVLQQYMHVQSPTDKPRFHGIVRDKLSQSVDSTLTSQPLSYNEAMYARQTCP